jgi:hypothetical protein
VKRTLVVTLECLIEVDDRSTNESAGWAAARAAISGQGIDRTPRISQVHIKRVKPAPKDKSIALSARRFR